MRDLTRYSLMINGVGGWLVFVSVLGIITRPNSNFDIGLTVLLPIIIMLNVVNYCFNNYTEPQKQIDDFLITSEIKSEQK